MKKKDHCKKCGQKLPVEPPPPPPKRFPEYLRGTVILPGIKHAEIAVTFKRRCHPGFFPWDDVGQYSNERRIEFPPAKKRCTIPDKVIANIEGVFYLVPANARCTTLEAGDQLNFERDTFFIMADEDLKE